MSVDGKTLYASSSDKVFSWGYDAANGTVDSSNKTVVTNMANPGRKCSRWLFSHYEAKRSSHKGKTKS